MGGLFELGQCAIELSFFICGNLIVHFNVYSLWWMSINRFCRIILFEFEQSDGGERVYIFVCEGSIDVKYV